MTRARDILIVDDDEDFRGLLRTVLEGEGCTVYEAANGKESLSLLGVIVPDLILMDLQMPVMNGWDLYAALQEDPALASIPVAVLSAVSRMRPLGHMHVLKKPLNLSSLLGLLSALDAPGDPVEASH